MNMNFGKLGIAALFAATVALFNTGCNAVAPVERIPSEDLTKEGTIVFTRPASYTPFFGNYSQRDFITIAYEKFSVNYAGQAVVEVGIRYSGPTGWTNWYRTAPDSMSLAARCNFYRDRSAQASGPVLYSTNRQPLIIKRGEIYPYRAVCPKEGAQGYQLVLGE